MSSSPLKDQLARTVDLPSSERICSLCPSTTETLFALGVGNRLVGRTDYCCHPADRIDAILSVGGTKKVNLARLDATEPDLVVAVREENDREQINTIADKWPTLILDPVDVESALTGIELLGRAVDAATTATQLTSSIRDAFDRLPNANGRRAVYLIWRKPFMAVGAGTFIGDVMERLGFTNVAAALDSRYPEVARELLDELRPELVLASSEPFPFAQQHLPELRELAPAAEPILVDGEMFSWHGVRMLEAARYFAANAALWGHA